MGIKFFTDSTADLPLDYLKEHRIELIRMVYQMEGVEYQASPFPGDPDTQTDKDFYEAMRAGAQPTTSQTNEATYLEAFGPALAAGDDVFYIAFSGGLTGQMNNAQLARETLKEKYPDRSVYLVDSLSATLGEGLLVTMAVREYEAGKSAEEIEAMLEEARHHVHHWFMVEDLTCLKRGGRISAATAAVGTLLNVKPILCVNDEGRLVPSEKAKGRKRAMKTLVSRMTEKGGADYDGPICLVHADADPEDVERLAEMVREQFGREVDMVATLSPIIGAHTGPGLLALIFYAPSAR